MWPDWRPDSREGVLGKPSRRVTVLLLLVVFAMIIVTDSFGQKENRTNRVPNLRNVLHDVSFKLMVLGEEVNERVYTKH